MSIGQLIQVVLTFGVFFGLVGLIAFYFLRKSKEPAALLVRWAVSAALIGGIIFFLYRIRVSEIGIAAVAELFAILVLALPLGILWAPSLGELVASPFEALYTGGGAEVIPAATYSLAHGRRKRGEIPEAVAHVRRQLERFPNDHAGILLLAEIQAEDLKDLPAAEETLLTYVHVARPEGPRAAAALHLLADLHIKHARNPEAARDCLQKIIDLFPDTPHSTMAAQRLAHLGSAEDLEAAASPRLIGVKHIPMKVGLQNAAAPDREQEAAAEEDEIGRCRAALDRHPLDFDTRERLVTLLAEHHRALEECHREIEFMVRQPTAAPRQIKRWLNLHADLDVKYGVYSPLTEEPLRRLIRLYPGSAAAEAAQSRMTNLKGEFRSKETSQTFQLGSYNKDLGLRE
jgi:tetratricopeptide (TPR) repeat protein